MTHLDAKTRVAHTYVISDIDDSSFPSIRAKSRRDRNELLMSEYSITNYR